VRGLEAVQLAALLRRQAESPALLDQLGALLIRQAPRLRFSDLVETLFRLNGAVQ
jgi:hypothetical protein